MPSCTRLCGSRPVMSRPSSRMVPAVGRSTPVNMLMIVVLPAPFGPISACRAPFSTESVTSLVATMPPNCFTRPFVSSTGAMSAPLGLAREARLELPLCRDGAFGDGGGEPQDLRTGQPKHGDDDNRKHDLLHEGQVRQHADRENHGCDHGTVDAAEHDHHDESETKPELPVLRVHVGQVILHQLEQHGADHAAV